MDMPKTKKNKYGASSGKPAEHFNQNRFVCAIFELLSVLHIPIASESALSRFIVLLPL
jgi:hypothetical protein